MDKVFVAKFVGPSKLTSLSSDLMSMKDKKPFIKKYMTMHLFL